MKDFFICRGCLSYKKKETPRQRTCSICKKIVKKRLCEKNRKRMNQRKGKTYIEIFGKKGAEKLLKNKKISLNKIISCEDCGEKIIRSGTSQFLCKICSKKRDSIAKKNYIKNNREKCKDFKRNRRAKEHNIIHDFSSKEWLNKLGQTNGICPECNKFIGVENLELDHIHPVSKAENGRVYTIDDVQPLCKSCNARKGGRIKK